VDRLRSIGERKTWAPLAAADNMHHTRQIRCTLSLERRRRQRCTGQGRTSPNWNLGLSVSRYTSIGGRHYGGHSSQARDRAMLRTCGRCPKDSVTTCSTAQTPTLRWNP